MLCTKKTPKNFQTFFLLIFWSKNSNVLNTIIVNETYENQGTDMIKSILKKQASCT